MQKRLGLLEVDAYFVVKARRQSIDMGHPASFDLRRNFKK